jgi:4-amino-4-deoxy-L-arabinose transferase-like glycosyltransferase
MEMQASGVCAAAVLLLSMCLIFSAQVRQFFLLTINRHQRTRGRRRRRRASAAVKILVLFGPVFVFFGFGGLILRLDQISPVLRVAWI